MTRLALALLATAGLAAQPPLPPQLKDVGIDQRLGQQVPLDLAFRDDTGRSVTLGEYFGKDKPVVFAPVYYECPMLCTMTLNGLVRAMRAMKLSAGRDYTVVTFSFDSRETPDLAAGKRKSYLEAYRRDGAEAGWHFLTGSEAAIRRLTQALGYRYSWDEKRQEFAHASGVMVATPSGKLARYLYGIEYPPRDLRLSLVEASEGKIGSPVDQVLLFCFHYDPLTGKYGVVVRNVLRVAGAGTALALATFIVTAVRLERRQRAGKEVRA
jgi:protein SCO1/2